MLIPFMKEITKKLWVSEDGKYYVCDATSSARDLLNFMRINSNESY